jgi:hypothetical protein
MVPLAASWQINIASSPPQYLEYFKSGISSADMTCQQTALM